MAALRGRALLAFLVVCVVWGSTYLAIRVGVRDLPPLLFAGLRFLVAGLLLLGGAMALGAKLPHRARDWGILAVVGLFLLAGGNSAVVWAEQFTPSGVASIFVVTVALWMAFFDAVVPGGPGRLSLRVIAGLLVGLVGTMLLVGTSPRDFLRADLRGPIALTLASASWAIGSVYYKRRHPDVGPYIAAAIQMVAAGLAVTLLGLAAGEASAVRITAAGLEALGYLVVFGSIVGYTAYAYALRHASATAVGTYAYVNPPIAVLLGRVFLGEPIGARTVLAMVLILGAVLWIQFAHRVPAPETEPAAAD
jgi:drug/metabolite transporter (DMT)-like permease